MNKFILVCSLFLSIHGVVQGQEQVSIYQPIQSCNIIEKKVSLISCKNSTDTLQNIEFLIYPSIDSLKQKSIERFSDNLPDKIVYLLVLSGKSINIKKISALSESHIVDLNNEFLNQVNFLYLNDIFVEDSIDISVPIKLK
jgi:hypothetical protein